MTILLLTAVLALLIGVVLGMLGGGGAILMMPLLLYVVGLEAKTAIAASLFVVGSTSVVGAITHARAGRVRLRVGAMFGIAAMAGAYGGGRLAKLVPSVALLVLFGLIMVATAIAMLKQRKTRDGAAHPLRPRIVLALGAAVGVLSGLVGAGGGFLIVPALTLFGGLAMRDAVGTSLFVIALQSFAGFAGHISHVELGWTLVLVMTAASLTGTLAGAALGTKVSAQALRRAFAWLVLAMGILMFATQLPAGWAAGAAMLTLVAMWLFTRTPTAGASAAVDP